MDSAQRARVVVVDDDEIFVRIIARQLDALVAYSLDEGIKRIAVVQPDFVLMDVRFDGPWRTGIDALPEVRAVSPRSRIVVMTCLPNRYDQERAILLGATRYCDKDSILATVASLQAPPASGRSARRSSAGPRRRQ